MFEFWFWNVKDRSLVHHLQGSRKISETSSKDTKDVFQCISSPTPQLNTHFKVWVLWLVQFLSFLPYRIYISPVKYNTKWHSLRRSANKWSNKWRCECVHSFPHHLSIPLSTQVLACTIWDSIAYTIQWYYPQNYTNLLGPAKRNNMTRYVGTSLFFTTNQSQLIKKVKHFQCEISPNFLTASTSGPNCQLLFNNHKFFDTPFFKIQRPMSFSLTVCST